LIGMREHSGTIGGALLGGALACWITAVSLVGGAQGVEWSDKLIIGLIVGGVLCFIFSVTFFATPDKTAERER
jgi:hypothetical protein